MGQESHRGNFSFAGSQRWLKKAPLIETTSLLFVIQNQKKNKNWEFMNHSPMCLYPWGRKSCTVATMNLNLFLRQWLGHVSYCCLLWLYIRFLQLSFKKGLELCVLTSSQRDQQCSNPEKSTSLLKIQIAINLKSVNESWSTLTEQQNSHIVCQNTKDAQYISCRYIQFSKEILFITSRMFWHPFTEPFKH